MVDGPNPYEHDPNDAWWRPGWTSQNHFFIPPDAEPPAPEIPDIPKVNVVATYFDSKDGPITGRLLIRPNATWRAEGGTVMPHVNAYPVTKGQLNILLPASDSPALEAKFTYTVREAFAGGRQFAISVPVARANAGPVEIHSLAVDDSNIIPIDSTPPRYGWHNPSDH